LKKSYILDTNVLIENINSITILRNGEENDILIPYSVLLELDRLKTRPNLSNIIPKILSILLEDSSIIFIKNDSFTYSSSSSNDDTILKDILYLFTNKEKYIKTNNTPIVVTNDNIFRLRLKIHNILSEPFLDSLPFKSESELHTGFTDSLEELNTNLNCFYWDKSVGKLIYNSTGQYIEHENTVWKVSPRNYTQNAALQLMLDPNIDIVSIQSSAGLGKTYLALATALQLTLQKNDFKKYRKIFIFKPIVYLAEKLGYLPGDYNEKLAPFVRNIHDLILKLHDQRPANKLFIDHNTSLDLDAKMIEILDLNIIRGMNIENAVVIVDEAQNLTRYQTRALLTRMGENVKCFILGDINQVDNPLLNSSNNGLNWVVKKFINHPNYGHIVLKGKYSRGPITDLVLKTNL
jgi:PhoH-like ATPase